MEEHQLNQVESGGSIPTSPLQCKTCGAIEVKLFSTFGKWRCRKCIENSPKRGTGNSGMVYHADTSPNSYKIQDLSTPLLIRVPKSHPLFVKWFIEHYPQSKGLVGRQLNYLIYAQGRPIGIITVSSPPQNYLPFKQFLDVESDLLYLNNSVYRIVFPTLDRNLGTKILKALRFRAKNDYQEVYCTSLVGLGTFVEPPRTGAIYKADNWTCLGQTQGIHVTRRGASWLSKTYEQGTPKLIFGRKL